jgi:hypothetical protein
VRFQRPLKSSQAIFLLAFSMSTGLSGFGQATSTRTSPAPSGQVSSSGAASDGNAQPSARPRSRHRARRRYASPTTSTQPAAASQTVGSDVAQRSRDARILASQKSQSEEIARQNSIVTGNVVKEREAQQAEPRIQDAPGPGSQPLAGDPAVQPAQSGDVPRIQDAPGPAQTLPKAPPAQTAPQPDQTVPPS